MHLAAQAARGLNQKLIARIVAQRIVDVFETVQIHIQHGHMLLAVCGAFQHLTQLAHQTLAVGQAGERVVVGQKLHV
ncbi:hypothetical protein D3C72_2408160 [compost metagenome]